MLRVSKHKMRCVAFRLSHSHSLSVHGCYDPSPPISIPVCTEASVPDHIAQDSRTVRVAITVTADEHRRPSFETRSSRLLFREHAMTPLGFFLQLSVSLLSSGACMMLSPTVYMEKEYKMRHRCVDHLSLPFTINRVDACSCSLSGLQCTRCLLTGVFL